VFRANPWQGSAARLADILAEEGIATEPGKVDPDSLWMKPRAGGGHSSFTKTGAYEAGAFIVQDEASSLAARFSGVGSGHRVLDPCAAPGGKTAVMAWMAGKRGRVVAADNAAARLGRLKINCARIGAPVQVVAMDAGNPAFGDVFDSVFVDAPCSGAGVIRRHPDARWRLRENDFGHHGEEQRAILVGAAGAVKPGGWLIYSVCSNEPEETDEVASAIDGAGFVREPAVDSLPAAARKFVGEDGVLRILPESGRGLDGFFAVRWRRVEERS
jgi:16S rRNA (cytosine967-C5)-methyltransferase